MKTFKFLIITFLSLTLFTSCSYEDILVEQQEQGANDDASLNRGGPPTKIYVCHYSADEDQWRLINVHEDAWADHVFAW